LIKLIALIFFSLTVSVNAETTYKYLLYITSFTGNAAGETIADLEAMGRSGDGQPFRNTGSLTPGNTDYKVLSVTPTAGEKSTLDDLVTDGDIVLLQEQTMTRVKGRKGRSYLETMIVDFSANPPDLDSDWIILRSSP